ncbi:MAG: hypothetical protein II730_00300 [Bacteroidales bacterium]|nr:hypothetical protein [Bacteroidales bacterium]
MEETLREHDEETVELLLTKPYHLIDILPHRVPALSKGQYFEIERHFLSAPVFSGICSKFASLLLKLNCYETLLMSDEGDFWTENPSPEDLLERFTPKDGKCGWVYFLLNGKKTLITFNGEDHYMTAYNLKGELLSLVSSIAASEGLFVWAAPE